MIVEFLGTPGAGKTTLATALVALMEEREIAAADVVGAGRDHVRRTRVGRLLARVAPGRARDLLLWQAFYLLGVAHAARFALERPALVRQAVRSQLRPGIRIRTRAHVLYWFAHLCGRYRFLTSTSAEREVLVLDDGFLQRTVHLYASPFDEPAEPDITRYVDLIPPPDLIVLVVAGWQECERRVRERGVWPHARHLSAAELSRYLERAERVVEMTTRRAQERAWTVIPIETEGGSGPSGLQAPLASVLASVAGPSAGGRPTRDGGSVA
jgi:hypothetical protein